MKNAILSFIVALSFMGVSAFANEPTAPAAGTVPGTSEVQQKVATKIGHKEAKEQCIKENPNLKGKDLKECIKGKRG